MAYVYRHIRIDKNLPFYIGISKDEDGKYKRAYSKRKRNKHWNNIVAITEYEVEIMMEDLSIEEAKQKEIELIALYGRIDLGTGYLCNWTNGGDGVLNPTEEFRNKVSVLKKGNKNFLGKKHSKETIEKLKKSKSGENHPCFGKKMKDETCLKISKANKGKPKSLEHRKKLSIYKTGKPAYNKGKKMPLHQAQIFAEFSKAKRRIVLKYDLAGNFMEEYESAWLASKVNDCNPGSISNCALGEARMHKGFMWKYKNGDIIKKIDPYKNV